MGGPGDENRGDRAPGDGDDGEGDPHPGLAPAGRRLLLPGPAELFSFGLWFGADLRTPAGLAVVDDLVRSADVVMHNLRPGKAEKLGIDYRRLAKIRPELVYCFLPGFGSTGPKAHLKSFAPLISGFTGLLYLGPGGGIRRSSG